MWIIDQILTGHAAAGNKKHCTNNGSNGLLAQI